MTGSVRPDAIVIPAYRAVDGYVRRAAELAGAVGCALIVLCSGQATTTAARKEIMASKPRPESVVAKLPTDYTSRYLMFETNAHLQAMGYSHDAHIKRNIGLLVGFKMGWKRLFFLNDDVTGLTRETLEWTVGALDEDDVKAAGWAFVGHSDDSPMHDSSMHDNSTVCHAYRLSGQPQDSFISDAALAVKLDEHTPHFPGIYNEDWLFIARAMEHGRVVLMGDGLRQSVYDPFADPYRGALEEFGDVLAEGIMIARHDFAESQRLPAPYHRALSLGPDYWYEVLEARWAFLHGIEARLRAGLEHRTDRKIIDRALQSVQLAKQRHESSWPVQLESWMDCWEADQEAWRRRCGAIGRVKSLADAFADLQLGKAPQKVTAPLSGSFAR